MAKSSSLRYGPGMADLKAIKFPEDLREHNLSEQELAPLTPQQQALAKDWNVIKRQSEWTMNKIVDIHNLLVEHDSLLEQWKFWLKMLTIVSAGGGGVSGLLYFLLKMSKGGS